ncbi:hypothetical protein ACWEIJ_30230 [Lentzea sp. NPDC004789]
MRTGPLVAPAALAPAAMADSAAQWGNEHSKLCLAAEGGNGHFPTSTGGGPAAR